MNKNEGYIRHLGYNLFYRKYGTGENILLAFHGFDQTSEHMQALSFAVDGNYTVYAFDVFFHGNSYIDEEVEDPVLTNSVFADMMQFFLDRFHIKKASLLGYSLGGKISMALVEVMPYKFENIFLLASDGFNRSFWNSFVARSAVGQYIFEKVIRHPEFFVKISGIMQKMKILPAKMHAFLLLQLESEAKRKKVYDVLLLFRELRPDLNRLRKTVKRYDFNLQIIVGKNDDVVLPQPAIDYMKKIDEAKLHILDCGHNLLLESDKIGSIVRNNSFHTVSWEMKHTSK